MGRRPCDAIDFGLGTLELRTEARIPKTIGPVTMGKRMVADQVPFRGNAPRQLGVPCHLLTNTKE